MIKTLTYSVICCLYLGLSHQVKGQNISSQQKSTIEKQVDGVFHEMIKSAESVDYDKLAQGVDDSNNAGFIINNTYYAKFDSLTNVLKARSQGLSRQTITIQKEKITVLSENIVLLTAFGDARVEVNAGNEFTIKFYWSFVYEKKNNTWKVVQSHQSGVR
jgi:hypothetical protein